MNRIKWITCVGIAVTAMGLAFWPLAGVGQQPRKNAVLPVANLSRHPGRATLQVGNKAITARNFSGRFGKVAVRPYQAVPITVSWPDKDTHAGVLVYPIYGGWIDGVSHKYFSLRRSKTIHFNFKNSGSPGTYEVILRRGATEEVLRFYVSRNPALLHESASK